MLLPVFRTESPSWALSLGNPDSQGGVKGGNPGKGGNLPKVLGVPEAAQASPAKSLASPFSCLPLAFSPPPLSQGLCFSSLRPSPAPRWRGPLGRPAWSQACRLFFPRQHREG